MLKSTVAMSGTAEKRDRNNVIHIQSPLEFGDDCLITLQREICFVKDGKRVILGNDEEEEYAVIKRLSEISAETVTLPSELGGATLTVPQIATALELLSDKFAKP